jgi:hypothetical protein
MNKVLILGELVLLCSAFAGGWFLHKPTVCPSGGSSSISDTTTVTDSVVKPDGTTVTHTVVHDVDHATEVAVAPAPLPQWSLQLNWKPTYTQERRWQPTGAMISRRVLGSLWLGLGSDWTQGAALIGLRYDW